MPLIVTDADVLAEVTRADGQAQGLNAAIGALGVAKMGPASTAQWVATFAAWTAWKTQVRAQLDGLFSGWLGVPELGNQALAWEAEFNNWQKIVNAIAAGQTAPVAPGATSPIQVADANADLAPVVGGVTGGGLSTGILVGAAALAAILLLVRR